MMRQNKPKQSVVVIEPSAKMSKKSATHDWRSFTYLDLFPFNPAYRFNGFRSLYGTALSILFLFAVFARVVTLLLTFISSDPLVYQETKPVMELQEFVPCPQLGVRLVDANNTAFYDNRALRVRYFQGVIDATSQGETEISPVACTILDPALIVKYENVMCPSSTGTLQGDYTLDVFKYMRLVIEECVNTTSWNPDTNTYIVNGGTTSGDEPCYPKEYIDSLASQASVTVFLKERLLRPNSWRKATEYFQLLPRKFPSGFFQSHQFFIGLTRVSFLARYLFDSFNDIRLYPIIAREEDHLADLEYVVGSDALQHMFRMEFVIRLDRYFINQFRQHMSMYTLFESWAASVVFFTGAFGSLAWLINRYLFKEQTRGLDIRKMDRDQFDKFGRLVDKSFQMPRELQDMQAE